MSIISRVPSYFPSGWASDSAPWHRSSHGAVPLPFQCDTGVWQAMPRGGHRGCMLWCGGCMGSRRWGEWRPTSKFFDSLCCHLLCCTCEGWSSAGLWIFRHMSSQKMQVFLSEVRKMAHSTSWKSSTIIQTRKQVNILHSTVIDSIWI